jgi:hypothetical protein
MKTRLAALMAIPFLLAGCGTTGIFAGSSGDPVKYHACLREHGLKVTVDGDATRIEGPDAKTGEEARAACKQFAPVDEGASAEDRKRMMDQGLKYAACLREHGVDAKDPVQHSDGGIEMKMPISKDAPALQAAEKACKSLMGPPR